MKLSLLSACIALIVIVISAVAGADAEQQSTERVAFYLAEDEPAEGLRKVDELDVSSLPIYLHNTPVLTGKDIAKASVAEDMDRPAIDFELTPTGAEKLAKVSKENLHKKLAIIVEGKLIAAPIIRSQLSKQGRITGSFDKEEAERLARAIGGQK
jgi:preprotein translocase subunit SecD